ncbi:MsgA-like virulence protein [Salmonella enterica subsp. enterica serovar Bovismorbificans]|uniref:MsgA-like virulence protein n=1 Tax=Salmonella enterica subsp. enterica serovar Bovismorbificans TaxID=58097 RepID=A0A655DEV4_SALET|nr:MsgA-like virulence protein [Salmonella enterica subsp. enterica serovar Bovismorbificans]
MAGSPAVYGITSAVFTWPLIFIVTVMANCERNGGSGILHELIGHLSCAVVTVKSMQATNVNHVCTKTEKAHLHPMLEEMFAVAGK